MTTSQHSASRLRPSRLCRYLACAVLLKLCLLGSMIAEPFLSAQDTAPVPGRPKTVPAPQGQTARDVHIGKVLLSPATAQAAPAAQTAPAAAPGTATAGQAAPQNGADMTREALQRRQEDIARKEQDLRTLEKDLDARLERLQTLEARLQMMLKEAEEVKSAKFRHLVDVLSNMKAKQAAEVLETLDEKIAVKVLSGMRGRQAGEILTFVKAPKAARLSESLARMQLPFE